jgi:hypothetical protein
LLLNIDPAAAAAGFSFIGKMAKTYLYQILDTIKGLSKNDNKAGKAYLPRPKPDHGSNFLFRFRFWFFYMGIPHSDHTTAIALE